MSDSNLNNTAKNSHDFHLVDPSPWPIFTSFVIFILAITAVLFFHDYVHHSKYLLIGASGLVLSALYLWWKDIIKEGLVDKAHTSPVRIGFKIAMWLFIFTEVMFFVAFFWSTMKAWIYPVNALDGVWIKDILKWPPKGIETLEPFDLPLINTLILLLSGTTVSWAHNAILNGNNKTAAKALIITVLLGLIFTALQGFEYYHATFSLGGDDQSAIYPSNFYLATGFHGAHVIIGTIFLLVCAVRASKNHFTKEDHVAFECAAWYWHFVDVVWLLLFILVYFLAG